MSLLKRIEEKQAREEGADPTARRSSLPGRTDYTAIKTLVQRRLLEELDPDMDISNSEEVRQVIWEVFERILDEEGIFI